MLTANIWTFKRSNIHHLMTIVRRRSPRRTNWRHRHDALTPAQKLRIRRLKASINELQELSEDVLLVILSLSMYMSFNPMLSINDPFFIHARNTLKYIQWIIDVDIMKSTISMLLLEYSLDNVRFMANFELPKNRSIDSFDDSWARIHTRFSCEQLQQLLMKWKVPQHFVVRRNGKVKASATGESCMIVALTYIATSGTIYRMFPGILVAVLVNGDRSSVHSLSISTSPSITEYLALASNSLRIACNHTPTLLARG